MSKPILESLLALTVAALCGIATAQPPEKITAADILSGRYNHGLHNVEISGCVTDAFNDDFDGNYRFIVLQDGTSTFYAAATNADMDTAFVNTLIGAQVTIDGVLDPVLPKKRRYQGRMVFVERPSDITVINPAPSDPFAVPELFDMGNPSPRNICGMGRRLARGRVLAVWQGNCLLLERQGRRPLSRIELSEGKPPTCGSFIEAVGYAETDLSNLNLSRARWRPADDDGRPPLPVTNVTAKALFTLDGMTVINEHFHGKVVRLRGTVVSRTERRRLQLEDEGTVVTLDVSALPDAEDLFAIGSRLEVTGVCVIDIPNWRPNEVFPHARGIFVVARTPDDLVVVSRPPWWTVRKLLAVIGALVGLLIAAAAWNRILRKLVERRGRELFKEQVSHVSANLRTEERTRLAIELHDSISQNLTGVTLQIKAAQTTAKDDLATALRHLDIAERSLTSCHTELRNCLWDLRHGTLESLDMSEAIRQVLRPQIGDVALDVRFSVPRRRLTDNTAYSILKIIRELSVNAVHHGQATSVKVAGALEPDLILFSVTDNGCGFDPKAAPGPEQGHFGLLGVTERINSFEGTMTVESTPGQGTRVVVTLRNLPRNEGQLT